MAGIYIHWPYCAQKCIYCDFHATTQMQQKEEMLDAICKEIEYRKGEVKESIKTIYFGGGTPSLLSYVQLERILKILYSNFIIEKDAELTLEANPDDLSSSYLKRLRSIGINRLSIGIQSFNDRELIALKRRHDSKQAIFAVTEAKKIGFSNISIDLIYGLPLSNFDSWKFSLDKALELNVEHMSAYHLTYENNTWLNKNKHLNPWRPIDEELSITQFNYLLEQTKLAGYEQYEISSFAKNSFYSKHNSSYWNDTPYLGIGPSAHSYNKSTRQWNYSKNRKYIECIMDQLPVFEYEILTQQDRQNDYILTGLRTMWGININTFKSLFGEEVLNQLIGKAQIYIYQMQLEIDKEYLKITDRGRLISDTIISDLLFIDSLEGCN